MNLEKITQPVFCNLKIFTTFAAHCGQIVYYSRGACTKRSKAIGPPPGYN